MRSPPRVCVFATDADPEAARLACVLGVPLVGAGALIRARPDAVVVRASASAFRRAALACTLAGAAAVILAPAGPPAALPAWGRRWHRLLLPSQAAARAWLGVGVPLGRLVVVEPGPAERQALEAVIDESVSMARRSGGRSR